MELQELNAQALAKFFQGGCVYLGANKDQVNALNVFPVPDGDTGINMFLTIRSAVQAIAGKNYLSVDKLAQDFSMGALMGARGNSGVILSQLFRGFSQSLTQKVTANARDMADAWQKGVDLSYKSVIKPVEGTILTVCKDMAQAAGQAAQDGADIIAMLGQALAAGEKSLANTPNLLPVLRQAGVVDAGGKGLLVIFSGGLMALEDREELDFSQIAQETKPALPPSPIDLLSEGDIPFCYCIEFLIKGDRLPLEKIQAHLSREQGDSLLVVGTEQVIKIHFHTNHPGKLIDYAQNFGSLHDLKIDNMQDQHRELDPGTLPVMPSDLKKCGLVAVAAGSGLAKLFGDLGAAIINGGQTMNPSAQDILKAIEKCPAEEIVVLPNNSNIILTARQAEKLAAKPVYVLPSKHITQGIAASLLFDENKTAAENGSVLSQSLETVKSGEITFAVRDSQYDGLQITAGSFLGILEGKIACNHQDLPEVLASLLEKMVDIKNDSLISLFYGHDLAEEQADSLLAQVEEAYPQMDIEMHWGGQPLYHFLISVE
ncbi:MAG: DAK2 domain-containing protein [Clostridiales bacterium]|nr:DAK2 domain-containing protein [Clostridiales bacterium]